MKARDASASKNWGQNGENSWKKSEKKIETEKKWKEVGRFVLLFVWRGENQYISFAISQDRSWISHANELVLLQNDRKALMTTQSILGY